MLLIQLSFTFTVQYLRWVFFCGFLTYCTVLLVYHTVSRKRFRLSTVDTIFCDATIQSLLDYLMYSTVGGQLYSTSFAIFCRPLRCKTRAPHSWVNREWSTKKKDGISNENDTSMRSSLQASRYVASQPRTATNSSLTSTIVALVAIRCTSS